MLFLRQVAILVYKNILIAFIRRPISTFLRALVLPIFIGWFFSYARNFFAAPALFGIGDPKFVRSLDEALTATGSRNNLVFVNNGFEGGQIEQIISEVGGIATAAGKNVRVIQNEQDLLTVCRNSLRGSSDCIAGVVFHSTPTEPAGQGLPYNYSLRYDGILGASIHVNQNNNDQQVFLLPLQKAIDRAIANVNGSLNVNAMNGLQEFPFTGQTQAQHENDLRLRYMRVIINVLGVAFFIGMCGIQYQQVGAQATEREVKMAQLLEVMMPNKRRWEPQIARLLSYHIAFTILYLPGWVIMAIILKIFVFVRTSYGIVIGYHILVGLSLASFSLFAAAFFKRAQLSGITTILVSLILAIIAQVMHLHGAAVYVLGLIFPSVNYVFFTVYMARFERRNRGTILSQSAPNTTLFQVKGIVLWIYLIIQIVVYPILAIVVERLLWGTTSGKRHLSRNSSGSAVELQGFSKHFRPNWFARTISPLFGIKRKDTVCAVDDLTITIPSGQIALLLGANGSGKSTTLDAIAGLSKATKGTIAVDFSHGLGFCPQQNVLWKDLTVYEHVNIFDRLKSLQTKATKEEKLKLISDCDLARKVNAKAGSLSGGQMRKLQLASMFTGKSRICLVDECSSGIDPLARRKVQDILLTERSRSMRTIIFTSHYLDEADIADNILIMSKGKLKVQGTAPEIKQSGQYRIHVYHSANGMKPPLLEGVSRKEMYDQTVYAVEDATAASALLTEIEDLEFLDYNVSGPTVEEAFMRVAEEMVLSQDKTVEVSTVFDDPKKINEANDGIPTEVKSLESSESPEKDLNLQNGTSIGPLRQGIVLFRKRFQVFLRSTYPNLAALMIVPIATGLVSLFLENFQRAGCIPEDNVLTDAAVSLATYIQYAGNSTHLVFGPQSGLNPTSVNLILQSLPANASTSYNPNTLLPASALTFVNSWQGLYDYVRTNSQRVFPGAVYLGNDTWPPLIAYNAQSAGYISFPVLLQNMASILNYRNPIAISYQAFDIPWQAGQGNTLQYTIYMALVLSVVPSFFALYPTLERLRHVRGLHYSNGVRALPLWLSYTVFDFCFVLVAATISVVVLAARFSPLFFGLGQFWVAIVFYGLCATLCSYVVSLFAPSQLAAFAISAAYQAATVLIYLIAYLSLYTYGDPNYIDRNLNYAHFTLAIIMPSASLFRALFVSLNVLSINCRGSRDYVGSPGDITAYGGPILYLIVQSLLLFIFLVWWDSGSKFGWFRASKHRSADQEEREQLEPEVAAEINRVTSSEDDGLRVLHLTKAYGKNVAVDDTSFGVKRGEVFGLLGPNGAGKSTTISVIRGDIKASGNSGDVFIENISLRKRRALARQHLSACPQYDAMDRLTVTEHLAFYARVRGVKEVDHNVDEIIRAVGLTKFRDRMGEKLSGGNKRKLSLGIALMGNPAVMLLDEPSSGMDVAAKRVMWRTLEAVVGGRSIVLTTHSMEEADRLCNRAGILAKRMLAIGTTDYLKRKYGDKYHVHLLLKSSPYTDTAEEETVKSWIQHTFPGSEIDHKSHHGQVRFSLPLQQDERKSIDISKALEKEGTNNTVTTPITKPEDSNNMRIASLFSTLETNKASMGFEYYSVSHATLDQVFLNIVSKHDVEEENAGLELTSNGNNGRGWWMRRIRGRG